jgi:transposase
MARTKILARGRRIALGLDVDARHSVISALDTANGEILFQGKVKHDAAEWRRCLAHFPDCELWACYEAGYSGFYLYRLLRELGVDCRVVAPSQVPKSPNQAQQKTDRRDAQCLAHLYFHPPRTFVRVPTEQEEQDRQLLRTREQLVRDKTRTQNRIKALLAFHHVDWPGTNHWSRRDRQVLRQMTLPESLRACLDAHLDTLEALSERIQDFNRRLVALSRTAAYHDRCARLCTLPGVGLLTAMAFLLEVFRPEDFATANALACHVGLPPASGAAAPGDGWDTLRTGVRRFSDAFSSKPPGPGSAKTNTRRSASSTSATTVNAKKPPSSPWLAASRLSSGP